jgi:hypothetical protein
MEYYTEPGVLSNVFGSNKSPVSLGSVETLPQISEAFSYSQPFNVTVNGKDLLRSVLASRGVTYNEPEPKKKHVEPTPEEVERRRLRREKNKVAAAKCRNKRKAQSVHIRQQHEDLQKSNTDLRHQLEALRQEVLDLKLMLGNHACILTDCQRSALEREIESDVDESFHVEVIESSCGSAVATPSTSSDEEDDSE